MSTSDPLLILLQHDRWATVRLLEAFAPISEEQFHHRFEMGPGSLHDTITHMISAMRTWTDTLVGRELRPRPDTDGQRRTPAQLQVLHDQACDELAVESQRLPLDLSTTRQLRDGRTVQMTRGAILTHLATHGMHHRAQCLNMLKQLGIKPLPPSSVAEWTMASPTARVP